MDSCRYRTCPRYYKQECFTNLKKIGKNFTIRAQINIKVYKVLKKKRSLRVVGTRIGSHFMVLGVNITMMVTLIAQISYRNSLIKIFRASGHLSETPCVNEPRVSKITETRIYLKKCANLLLLVGSMNFKSA